MLERLLVRWSWHVNISLDDKLVLWFSCSFFPAFLVTSYRFAELSRAWMYFSILSCGWLVYRCPWDTTIKYSTQPLLYARNNPYKLPRVRIKHSRRVQSFVVRKAASTLLNESHVQGTLQSMSLLPCLLRRLIQTKTIQFIPSVSMVLNSTFLTSFFDRGQQDLLRHYRLVRIASCNRLAVVKSQL